MDLAPIAAFTAAGFSIAGVALSAYLGRRHRVQIWRQDAELPIAAGVLAKSDEALSFWSELVLARSDATWSDGSSRFDELQVEVRKLDLIAATEVRLHAAKLVQTHESLRHLLRPASGADDRVDSWNRLLGETRSVVDSLIQAVRRDLGTK